MTPLEYMRAQVGVSEATGHNDGIPAQRYMRGDELAWCAGLVLTAFEKAGCPLPGSYWKNRNVAVMMGNLMGAGAVLGSDELPQPGDVVIFNVGLWSGRTTGASGLHVGMVERVDGDAQTFTTIEGNVSNRVARRGYSFDDPSVVMFARWV